MSHMHGISYSLLGIEHAQNHDEMETCIQLYIHIHVHVHNSSHSAILEAHGEVCNVKAEDGKLGT